MYGTCLSVCLYALYALRVLRAHGMPDDALQLVYHSVIVGRLLYASCAWSGFVSVADRKRVDAFLRRSKRCGFCPTDLHTFDDLLGPPEGRDFVFYIVRKLMCSVVT